MSLRCMISGDCRRVVLPAVFCLTSLVSLLFANAYMSDRAMLHEAEIRAQTWLHMASRQLEQSPDNFANTLAQTIADTQIDGIELLATDGKVLASSGRTITSDFRRSSLGGVPHANQVAARLLETSGDTPPEAIVALNTQSAIPGTHAALLTVDVSATRGQYWALAGWQLITLAALLALTSGVQGSSCIMNLRRLRVARNEIEHVAKHDALTGLPNRRLFHERLRAGLAAAERNGAPLAVLLLDLDRFKMINDTLGHPAGDELLQGVASRLQGLRRSGDMVARLGGDEFALLIVGLRSAEESTKLAQRIVDALAEPFTLQGRTITSAASVGIAISPDDGADPDELLAKADMALYRAKAGGRSRAERFAPAMQATVEDDRRVEEELRTALSNNQFGLLYQPQIDLVTGAVVGVEALLRWHHADRGLLAPGDFLRVAEETGLMPEIGGLVLDHACSQLRCWLDDGIDIGRLAVNLSPAQMSGPSLVENVLDRLRHYDLDASSMVLEITEGCVMGPRGEDVAQMLVQLRSADIGLALDDFGTGYASLRHLRTLPISQLKIDRDFVRDLMLDEDDSAIVRAMISLAHDLGLEVVAEGIEKSEQIAVLKQFGCDFGQGYAFAHPMPAADMVAFVRTRMPPRLAVVESGYAARAGSKVGPLLPFAN